jgi:hypothetical protein
MCIVKYDPISASIDDARDDAAINFKLFIDVTPMLDHKLKYPDVECIPKNPPPVAELNISWPTILLTT